MKLFFVNKMEIAFYRGFICRYSYAVNVLVNHLILNHEIDHFVFDVD
jgi:hypothetical protein